jgi:hypothetical protein
MKNREEGLRPFSEADFTEFLHPAQAFVHPQAVVDDPGLSLNEKRAVLAAWASDACAVEAAPGLRQAPGGANAVSVDEILEALRELDRRFASIVAPSKRRPLRRSSIEAFRARRAESPPAARPTV